MSLVSTRSHMHSLDSVSYAPIMDDRLLPNFLALLNKMHISLDRQVRGRIIPLHLVCQVGHIGHQANQQIQMMQVFRIYVFVCVRR